VQAGEEQFFYNGKPKDNASSPMIDNPTSNRVNKSEESATDSQQQPNQQNGNSQIQQQSSLPPLPPLNEIIMKEQFPFSTKEIKEIKKQNTDQNKVINEPVIKSKAEKRGVNIDTSPGAKIPVIHVNVNEGATLNFLDAFGQPWAIQGAKNFSKNYFTVWHPMEDSHMLTIESLKEFGDGNLVVFLKGLNYPINLQLKSGTSTVDYSVDLRINKRGPASSQNSLLIPSAASVPFDKVMQDFLDDVPPSGSKSIKVSGVDGKAWIYNGMLFYRGKQVLSSPAYKEILPSSDGTRVYKFDPTPVIMLIDGGNVINVVLGE
jgi:intracellular multiplication protein IcmK